MMWTKDKVKLLQQLWGSGLTAQQIANTVGGITRNAVIGKANRINLSKLMKNGRLEPPPIISDLPAEPAEPAGLDIPDIPDLPDLPDVAVSVTVSPVEKKPLMSRASAQIKEEALEGFKENVKQLEFAVQSLAAPSEATSDEAAEPTPLNLSLLALSGETCKWPVESSDEGAFHFCGHLTAGAGSYCAYHTKLAFHPNQLKRRKAT